MDCRTERCCWGLMVVMMWMAGVAGAVTEPSSSSPIAEKAFLHPDLDYRTLIQPLSGLPDEVARLAKQELAMLGIDPSHGFLDSRGLRWKTLIITRPMIPGEGVYNKFLWRDFGLPGRPDSDALKSIAWDAVAAFVDDHSEALKIELAELGPARVSIHDNADLIQIISRRQVGGIPVAGSFVSAVLKKGNLILFGIHEWGDVDPMLLDRQALSGDQAAAKVASYLSDVAEVSSYWREPELRILPTVVAGEDSEGQTKYQHRLVWEISPDVPDQAGRWQVSIDATNATILALQDRNSYQREIEGGVYPLTNNGVPPAGVEVTSPMPFIELTDGVTMELTDHGGHTDAYPAPRNITTHLEGEFVRIADGCGNIDEMSTDRIFDLGTSSGTNCLVPAGSMSPGNTPAARTAFYELNRIRETGRGQLPGVSWLVDQLPARTNIGIFPPVCNAFWDPATGTVNFFRSDPGVPCSNSGEIASIIAHEWAHGLDDEHLEDTISSPGEGFADAIAALRLNDSCMGRGFLPGTSCPGCLSCDGVRDIDFMQHTSGMPHDVAWISANCAAGPRNGPCGGGVHCEGRLTAEAVWDLVHRELPAPPYNMDFNTALEVATRLTFLASEMVLEWFTCTADFGGCSGDGGYMNFLTVDDDNGSLVDGTPHMEAIFNAFGAHGIACDAIAPTTSACVSAPLAAPVVTAQPLDGAVALSWTTVPGALSYQIFRTEGIFGCDFGKILVGETMGDTLIDSGLRNGREYYYIVVPVGSDPSCMDFASSCTPMTPRYTACGDCNGDGQVSVLDALAVAQHAVGNILITGPALLACDVEADGDVDIIDALKISQASVGLPGITLECIPCGDCDLDGHPRQPGDEALLTSLVPTNVTNSAQAACDLNGDARIDSRDALNFQSGEGCVTCGDSNLDGAVTVADTVIPLPYPFLPGTRNFAASDVTAPAGVVDGADATEIQDYLDPVAPLPDLVCSDPQAASPKPRLTSWMGSYCVSGTSNGTPFDFEITGSSVVSQFGVVAPVGQRDPAGLAMFLQSLAPPFGTVATPALGACFTVSDPMGAMFTVTVDGCDPTATSTGCPFG